MTMTRPIGFGASLGPVAHAVRIAGAAVAAVPAPIAFRNARRLISLAISASSLRFLRRPVRRHRSDLLCGQPLRDLVDDRRPARAVAEIAQLQLEVARRLTGEVRDAARAHPVGAVADRTGSREVAAGVGVAALRGS